MLKGRESLIALIGKRRRFLPNRHLLLSSPFQNSLKLDVDESGRIVNVESADRKRACEARELIGDFVEEETPPPPDDVTCPVCTNTISGGGYAINTHLDVCLSRRTKRKLTQPTLLQSKLWSRSKTLPQESEDSANTRPLLPLAVEECDSKECDFEQTYKGGSSGSPGICDNVCCKVEVCCSTDDEVLRQSLNVTLDDIHGMTLDTFIVGRRFSDVKELNVGASISLLRDPDNVKDPNAIKVVLPVDSGFCQVLGYLPKELSECLSPLTDKYCLNFEGTVTSIPKRSSEVVPIKIVCQKMVWNGQNECNSIEDLKLLWRRALEVVEHHRKFPRNMTKYQQNFNVLIQEVIESNSHLFVPDEKAFLESFPSLSDDSQRLFIRLYTRKGPWFRHSNITYPEVSDSLKALKELTVRGFMCSSEDPNELHDTDMKEILDLLAVSELREILSTLKKNLSRASRKRDLISSLYSSYKDGTCPSLARMILDRTGPCVRVSVIAESLLWRTERLFFLNGEQDLSSFVLLDFGIVKYPTYNCIVSEQIFSSQMELLAYEEAIEVAQITDESLDKNDIGTVLRCIMIADSRMSSSSAEAAESTTSTSATAITSRFTASWVYSNVVFLGISFLEHHKMYNHAVRLLKRLLDCFTCDGRRGYWTVRLSTDLEHIGSPNESLSVAEEGLEDPWVRAGSRVALQRRILRLAKPPRRWKAPIFADSIKRKIPQVHIHGRPLNCEIGMKNRFYGQDGEQCGVEQLALQYYAGLGGGWQGVHTESGIWLTIFGILTWDILFSDVPNVFRTRFQTAPLDLETDSFYVTRKNLIEARLENISNGMAEEILIVSWESHYGTACRGVNWERHSLSELRAAVACVGGPSLASLCRYLAQDYRSWSSGMPDLLLWRFHTGYKGEAKLVEVKGPRDQLSEQQRAWLLLLVDCGFNVEVCRVSPAATAE